MNRDKGPIQEIALAQFKAGAGMIDANIGPAEDGGADLMEWMVTTIQEAVQAPICLDTTNYEALEAGLKVHNNEWGRPLQHLMILRDSQFSSSLQNTTVPLSA